MAESTDSRVNLAALKRVDPYAKEIVETGTQVAVYKFNPPSNEWEKTDIEGTLFLYARTGDPRHGFVVMNRLSTENLVEPITKDLEIQLQAPFLLYRNAKNTITGVWFYEETECTRLAQKLESLVKEESRRRRPNSTDKPGVDILSLLTKAHGEYEQKKGKGQETVPVTSSSVVDVVRPTAVRATTNGVSNSTSLSVADLFATEHVGPVPMPLHHGGSLIERLLAVGTPPFVPPPTLPSTELHTAQNLERELRGKLKVSGSSVPGDKSTATPPPPPSSYGPPLRSGPTISHPVGLPGVPSHPQIADALQKVSATPPRIAGVQSVPLMSPMMFATASGANVPEQSSAFPEIGRPSTPVVRHSYKPVDEPESFDADPDVTPLTKAQLMQAFNFLLKNDPNFITQLHDAYVRSLKQSLKVGQ